MNTEQLLHLAGEARSKAYTPYSNFKVGAALYAANKKVYMGCNIENSSYGLTNCAERTAIFTAIAEGTKDFKKMAVIADTDKPVAPCGACRQVMVEFFDPQMEIILGNLKGQTIITTVAELLPGPFVKEDLHEQNKL